MGRVRVLLVVLFLLLMGLGIAFAAPAPPPRRQPTVLTAGRLVGTWRCSWGGSVSTLTLAADGTLRETYGTFTGPATAARGTWGVRDGLLWITETWLEGYWTTFAVRLDPATLSGPVAVGFGAPTTTVTLRRP